MSRNHVLRLQTSTPHQTITVRVGIRGMQVGITPWSGLQIRFHAARKTSGPVLVPAESPQLEGIDAKEGIESNHALQVSIKICRAQTRTVPGDALIKPGIKTDRLLSS